MEYVRLTHPDPECEEPNRTQYIIWRPVVVHSARLDLKRRFSTENAGKAELVTHQILCQLGDDVAQGSKRTVGESEGTIRMTLKGLLVCTSKCDARHDSKAFGDFREGDFG